MKIAPLIRLAKRPSRREPPAFSALFSSQREKHSGQRRIAPLQTKPTTPATMTAPQPDYTNWSTSDLISHIHKLESQLQQNGHTTTANTDPTRPPPFKKPRKAPKPFDASRYNTRLIALRFAYLGGAYNGFEHHIGNKTPLPTIEEELWKALRKTKLIFPAFKEGKEEEICWDGVDYSKCGRTDRGVSAFGQVIGVRVRSARGVKAKPKKKVEGEVKEGGDVAMADATTAAAVESKEGESQEAAEPEQEPEFDPIQDELPYIHLLNKVLPPDIRMLAWCPNPPEDFSARFNCKERRYRYFFTNPAFTPLPGSNSSAGGDGWLNIQAMQEAAKKYEGLHDFRNFCKIDPSKQITNFQRRIFHAGIHAVGPKEDPANLASQTGQLDGSSGGDERGVATHGPQLYWFEVRGSAFLWHQVRHLIAVLFLVGQGHEDPSIVDRLLDVEENPSRPLYEMASDAPLVLWDCVFPDPEKLGQADHAADGEHAGYEDGLNWIHIGDGRGGQDKSKRNTVGVEDGKYGRGGLMEDLWALWRRRKMDEILAGSLMNVVGQQGKAVSFPLTEPSVKCDRVYDGSELPRSVGTYVPVMKRARTEEPDVVNARYAAKKGIPYPRVVADGKGDDDE
jgi:tRNA pseudouridine38/39 synthase